MSNIKMRFADRKALVAAAKLEADVIDDRQFHEFLKEVGRWGGTKLVRATLENVRIPKGKAKRKAWKKNAKDAGFKLIFPPAPQWVEINGANLTDNVPAEWEARDVTPIVTPADPEADPPTEAVYGDPRPRQYGELHKFQTRTVSGTDRYFAPLANGVDYFDDDKVDAITTAAGAAIVATFDIEDLPQADET